MWIQWKYSLYLTLVMEESLSVIHVEATFEWWSTLEENT